jgi:hypothetical protein
MLTLERSIKHEHDHVQNFLVVGARTDQTDKCSRSDRCAASATYTRAPLPRRDPVSILLMESPSLYYFSLRTRDCHRKIRYMMYPLYLYFYDSFKIILFTCKESTLFTNYQLTHHPLIIISSLHHVT